MKLTRKQLVHLGHVVYHLERAEKFLAQENVLVCRTDSMATTTQHYINSTGQALYPINKEIGCDLTGLYEGIRLLRQFLFEPKKC